CKTDKLHVFTRRFGIPRLKSCWGIRIQPNNPESFPVESSLLVLWQNWTDCCRNVLLSPSFFMVLVVRLLEVVDPSRNSVPGGPTVQSADTKQPFKGKWFNAVLLVPKFSCDKSIK